MVRVCKKWVHFSAKSWTRVEHDFDISMNKAFRQIGNDLPTENHNSPDRDWTQLRRFSLAPSTLRATETSPKASAFQRGALLLNFLLSESVFFTRTKGMGCGQWEVGWATFNCVRYWKCEPNFTICCSNAYYSPMRRNQSRQLSFGHEFLKVFSILRTFGSIGYGNINMRWS